jgi:HAD superfamily hydrolase (TIGR01509 family)
MDAPARPAPPIRALVFDFDGLILDTESAAYQSWAEIYESAGLRLALERWVDCVGTDHSRFDPYQDLEAQLGRTLDRAELRARLRDRQSALNSGQPVRPGVVEALERARDLGLLVGLASSADRAWLDHHLGRLGLAHRFAVIASRDDVERVKPDPALYLHATRQLGVAPEQALAIEDSPNGIRAAKRAGLRCLAVPNPITAGLGLHEADLVVPSLASLSLDAIVARVGFARRSSGSRELP